MVYRRGKIEDGWVTSGEAARILGITQPTLRAWERKGYLPPSRRTDGGWRLYHLHAITAIAVKLRRERK